MRIFKSFTVTGLLVLVLIGLTTGAAKAAVVTVPVGLNVGDQYRLAFVTQGTRDSISPNIEDYNAFVTAEANSIAALAALQTTWRVIASTATVDARDNTGTNVGVNGVGDKIFLLDGELLALNNNDLWDGSILRPLNVRSDGGQVAFGTEVWTGTIANGTAGTFPLGSGFGAGVGCTNDVSSSFWIFCRPEEFDDDQFAFYVLSGTITVAEPVTAIPLPAALPLFLTGLAGLGLMRRRQRQRLAQRI